MSRKPPAASWLLLLLVSLVGCSSTPETRYHSLTPAQPTQPQDIQLHVSRVQMPDYLDDTRLWVRNGPHQFGALPNVRWVEPFPRAMTRSLQHQLGESVAESDDLPRLLLDVHHFEALWATNPEQDRVVLTVLWQIRNADATAGRITLEEPLPDREVATLVTIKSELVNQLGVLIAESARINAGLKNGLTGHH